MKGTVLYGPGDVCFEERMSPKIQKPTDAIIKLSATCICGSDLWPYRGIQPINRWPRAIARWTNAARSRRCCAPEVVGETLNKSSVRGELVEP